MTAFTHTLQLPWTYELDNDGIAWVALSQEVQNSRACAPANASLSSLIIGGEVPCPSLSSLLRIQKDILKLLRGDGGFKHYLHNLVCTGEL
mmetsp:Transcript_27619/g.66525  ORF Transcript_27619/g.66525 Transcript_27619/m.66525 type:complete len:91 (+) Transcript_27619:884-1156(+)